MITFDCKKITGFYSENPVKIFRNGKLFYSFDKVCKFNLPIGRYQTYNQLSKLKHPVHYNLKTLPRPERDIKLPSKFTVLKENNPNKCSVNMLTGVILIDPNFAMQNPVFLTFVLFHELGHYLYETEWKCDVFASNQMLKRGYNPSQCFNSSYHTLKNNYSGFQRKFKTLSYLPKHK